MIAGFLSHTPHEWLLFVDSDMTPDPQTIGRLLSHNVDVVGALYYSRDGKYEPMYEKLPGVQPTATGLVKVDWVGTGCMLIRRKVLEAMQPPYMQFMAPGFGEDVFFCRNARNLGFEIYVDTGLCAGHMTALPIDAEEARLHQHRQQPKAVYDANGVRVS